MRRIKGRTPASHRGRRTSGNLAVRRRSEEHTSELQSPCNIVCRLLLEKNNKLILNEELKERYKYYGLCEECKQPNTGYNWCQNCNAKRFQQNFKNWTSGNDDIDELLEH